MRFLAALLFPLTFPSITAQPTWKEFSLGPVTTSGPPNSQRLKGRGVLSARSITAKSLIALAAGVFPSRVLGPDWLDSECYSITAIVSDDSRGHLRRRLPGSSSSDEEFWSMFRHEITSRFQLTMHTERKDRDAFVVQPLVGGRLKVRQSKSLEGGQVNRKGTPMTNVYSTVDARGLTLMEFCGWLERQLNAPVIPSSSLPPGTWDFHVHWQSGDQRSLLAAVRDQVGLDLVEGNASVEYLIVDRVDRPPSRL